LKALHKPIGGEVSEVFEVIIECCISSSSDVMQDIVESLTDGRGGIGSGGVQKGCHLCDGLVL
jgi:hypothetical protein